MPRTPETRHQLNAIARKHRNLGEDFDYEFHSAAEALPDNPSYSQMEDTAKFAEKEAKKTREMKLLNTEIKASTPLEDQWH